MEGPKGLFFNPTTTPTCVQIRFRPDMKQLKRREEVEGEIGLDMYICCEFSFLFEFTTLLHSVISPIPTNNIGV